MGQLINQFETRPLHFCSTARSLDGGSVVDGGGEPTANTAGEPLGISLGATIEKLKALFGMTSEAVRFLVMLN
jgi:hypothetical protein